MWLHYSHLCQKLFTEVFKCNILRSFNIYSNVIQVIKNICQNYTALGSHKDLPVHFSLYPSFLDFLFKLFFDGVKPLGGV